MKDVITNEQKGKFIKKYNQVLGILVSQNK